MVLKLSCSECRCKIEEDALFYHLRKRHGLRRAGKNIQRVIRENNDTPIRSDFGQITMPINPLFIREIFVRYLSKSFRNLIAIFSAHNFDKRIIPRFTHSLENEDNTHLFKIGLGN